MRSESTALLIMADSIPGYSRDQLLADLEPLIASKKFYTTQELAERYEVTIQTIKNWTKDKKLVPTLKVGDGCVRYSAADLAEFEKKFPG
jgi:hypothetical protein